MIKFKVYILLIFIVMSCKTQEFIPKSEHDMTKIRNANLEGDVFEKAFAISKHHYEQFYYTAGLPARDDSLEILNDTYFVESVDNVFNGLGFYFFIDKNLSTDYEFVIIKNYDTGKLQQLANLIESDKEEYTNKALEFFFQKSIENFELDKNSNLKNLSNLWIACRWGIMNTVEITDRDVKLIAQKLGIKNLSHVSFNGNSLEEGVKTIEEVVLIDQCRIYKYQFILGHKSFRVKDSLMGICSKNIKI